MKKLVLFIFLSIFIFSCSSYKDAMSANSNIKKIELGMSQNEVIHIMGKSYHRMGAVKDPNGVNVEILGYPTVEAIYMLRFENGVLVEFHKDLTLPTDRALRETSAE